MKQKICDTGYSCGRSCIQRSKKCRDGLKESVSTVCDKAVEIINRPEIGHALLSDKFLSWPSEEEREDYEDNDDMETLEGIEDTIGDEISKLIGSPNGKQTAAAIYDFTHRDYSEMREIDRSGGTDDRVELINNFLSKAPIHGGTLYRGLANVSADTFKIGAIIELDAMSSFSSKPDIAAQFSAASTKKTKAPTGEIYNEMDVKNGVILKVLKSKTGCSIAQLSEHPREDEVLVPKGSRYRILSEETHTTNSVYKSGVGTHTIKQFTMEEI